MGRNQRSLKAYQCIQAIAVIASAALLIVAIATWVTETYGDSRWNTAKEVAFTSIQGGCTMQLAWTAMRTSCSTGGGGLTTCNCLSLWQYNVSVTQPTAALTGAYLSEINPNRWSAHSSGHCDSEYVTTDVDTTSSATSCWYADDPVAAADAGFPCGSPSCMKVEDPSVYIDLLEPDGYALTLTIVCAVVIPLIALVLFGPKILPGACARIGIAPRAKSDEWSDGAELAVYDREWGNLTEEQRAAAATLGYTKRKWSNDADTPANDKDWSDLTADEQKAATTLGYTQSRWDSDC